MLFNLSNPLDVQNARTRLNLLIERGAMAIIEEKKLRRSLPQNSYLHLLLGYFASQTGCTLEWVKERYYKLAANRELFLASRTDPVTGKPTNYLRSSALLTSDEMALSITRFRNWAAAEAGIYLPEAHSQAELAALQIEVERYKTYL